MADKQITEKMNPEDSSFIPEIERDDRTGEMVDVNTRKKYIKPFIQKPYNPSSEYEG